MRPAVAVVLLALLASGCFGGGKDDPGAPHDDPVADPAADGRQSTPAEGAEEAPVQGPRTESYEGNLTFEQDAAIVCPLYVESSGRSSTQALDLADAVGFEFTFDWTPAVPAFQGAILALHEEGTSIGGDSPDVRGRSVLEWRMDGQQLADAPDDALLSIVGPACLEDQDPAQSGVDYEQVIHFVGTVTYAS